MSLFDVLNGMVGARLCSGSYCFWGDVDDEITSGVSHDIRCMHCHGSVRVHKRQVEHGPADHVEHRSRQDSERCRAGVHFQGAHQMSLNPVL